MRYRLEDLLTIKYGKNQKKVVSENGNIPILGTGGWMGWANDFLYDKPSVLIPRKGSISKVQYIDRPFWTVDTLFYTIINEELIIPKYLFYKLSQIDLSYYNEGTTIPSLRTETLNRIELDILSLEEQRTIVEILDSIEEKITINNEMNSKLETAAQTIFKHWFDDFEFPNENGDPYKTSGAEFVESELGLAPDSWKVISIGKFISVSDGTHASPKKQKNGFPLITSKHIKNNTLLLDEANLISEKDYIEVNRRSKVDTKDILITMIGTVGVLYYVREEEINFAIKNIGLFKSSEQLVYANYIYLYLSSKKVTNYIQLRLAGSTQQYISLGELRGIPFLVPSLEVIEKFNELVDDLYRKIRINTLQNETLSKLRDTILPKLMSGNIRVSRVEQEDEECFQKSN